MTADKERDDEIYAQGVHDGQDADLFEQASHSLAKGFSLDQRENEIYNRGFDYGVSHKSDDD
jgi:hypothetical protein